MAFSTKECAWAQITVKLLGRTLVGIRAFEVNLEVEKELLYGAGQKAIDILEGNEKVDGSLTLLKYEVDQLNQAAQTAGYENYLKVPYSAMVITVAFQLTSTSALKTLTVPGAAFTKMNFGNKQNDKGMEVQLPFVATGLVIV